MTVCWPNTIHFFFFNTQQILTEEVAAAAATSQEKENPVVAESPSFRKLPRESERVSDVANAAGSVDILSPPKKGCLGNKY